MSVQELRRSGVPGGLARALLAATLLAARVAAAAPEAPLKLPAFDALASKAVQSVQVTLDANLLGLAAGFLDSSKPDEAGAREIIAGLKGIYVRSYTFDKDFPYPQAEVDSVRKQLTAPGWQPLVQVQARSAGGPDKDPGQDGGQNAGQNVDHNRGKDPGAHHQGNVDIYISMSGGKANGLAIIASGPRDFTIVNIVGSIDLQKLHQLQGKFGIPALPEDRK
jgi:hypothetical protein